MSDQPPVKRAKPTQEFVEIVSEAYDLKFKFEDEDQDKGSEKLEGLIEKIRSSIENVVDSKDISFGTSIPDIKSNWTKCLSLLLADGYQNTKAVNIMIQKLNPGAGFMSINTNVKNVI